VIAYCLQFQLLFNILINAQFVCSTWSWHLHPQILLVVHLFSLKGSFVLVSLEHSLPLHQHHRSIGSHLFVFLEYLFLFEDFHFAFIFAEIFVEIVVFYKKL
jgi:hypothetical protein